MKSEYIKTSLWFFGGIYIVYAALLFRFGVVIGGTAGLYEQLVESAVELFIVSLVCHVLLTGRSRLVQFIGVVLVLASAVIVAGQSFSIYLSGNVVSILAIENAESAPYTRNKCFYILAAACTVWCLAFLTNWHVWGKRHYRRPLFITFATIFVLVGFEIASIAAQDNSEPLAIGRFETPIASLLRNYAVVLKSGNSHANAAEVAGAIGYPLEKPVTYRSHLPYKNTGNDAVKNVIVFFTEGTSARLIGAYGGKFPNLTPNIDKLAGISMRVDNYFNASAPTFRGIAGQLTSGYPRAGGAGADGWVKQADKLRRISRQSVPQILNPHGYDNYFISPHHESRSLNVMLRSLGFDTVFSFDRLQSSGLIKKNPSTTAGSLSDGPLFNGLIALLKQHAAEPDAAPLFIGTYNVGTHTFINVGPDELHYGDGTHSPLNRLHNYDAQFGRFLDYFLTSPYRDNTILIFTADHANYPEPPYRALFAKGEPLYFVDRIPLLIYDPFHDLPANYDASYRTSIDLAPTLLQILGIRNAWNSFVGSSIFSPRKQSFSVAAQGETFYSIDENGVHPMKRIPKDYALQFSARVDFVKQYYKLEAQDRIFEPRNEGSLALSR